MRHVPYSSQWASPQWNQVILAGVDPCDDPTWFTHGFPDRKTYRFWSQRMCGIACLESMLLYWKIDKPCRYRLLKDALSAGVYVLQNGQVHGLVYRPFAVWVSKRFGLNVQVRPHLELVEFGAGVENDGFVMASVSREIRNPRTPCSNPGGHLVLVFGVEGADIRFHNPSGIPPHQSDTVLQAAVFAQFFAGRGLIIRRK